MQPFESFSVSANKCWVAVGTLAIAAMTVGCGTHGWGQRHLTKSSPTACCEAGPACDQSCTSFSDYPPAFPPVVTQESGLLGGDGLAPPPPAATQSPVNVAPFPGKFSQPESKPAMEAEEVDPMALGEETEL